MNTTKNGLIMKKLGPKKNFLFIDRVQNIDFVIDSINKNSSSTVVEYI